MSNSDDETKEISTQPEDLKPKKPSNRAPQGIRTFTVCRQHDESGVSGEGVVIAIDVGSSIVNGYQVLENVVLVVPAYKIDWSTIMEYDDLVPQEEKETN